MGLMRRYVLLLLLALLPETASAQTVGILPFADESAPGSRTAGAAISRMLQTELGTRTLKSRVITLSVPQQDIDADRAAAIGREHKVDLVFVGTVREADARESTKSGWLPRIQGQTANLRLRSIKATVKLAGVLYDVASGREVASVRAEGTNTDNTFSGTLWSSIGAWDTGTDAAFRESPLGKAVEEAVEDLAINVTKELSRR
jgi:hypothetical protein